MSDMWSIFMERLSEGIGGGCANIGRTNRPPRPITSLRPVPHEPTEVPVPIDTKNRIESSNATIHVGDVDIQVTSDPKKPGVPVINIRSNSGPAVINYGNATGGFDLKSVGRSSKSVAVDAAPTAEPVKRSGFFGRVGHALGAPLRFATSVAAKSPTAAKILGIGTGVLAGASGVATAASLTGMLAPEVLHGVLFKLGMLGLFGPQSAAVVLVILFGGVTIMLGAEAVALLRAAKKAAPVAEKDG